MIQVYILAAIIVISGGALYTYNNAIERAEQAEQIARDASLANTQLTERNKRQDAAIKAEQSRSREANERFSEAQAEIDELGRLFAEHDLDFLFQNRPDTIIRLSNSKSMELFYDVAKDITATNREITVREPSNN